MFGQNKEVLNRNELETASYWQTVNDFQNQEEKIKRHHAVLQSLTFECRIRCENRTD
jgi:hypothetical protein